jgi:16S rRNA (cytosine967-C5)-methyltransferase
MTENEDQAAAFLERHPDFRQVPCETVWKSAVWPENGPPAPSTPYLRLTPATHDTDGFFAAVFERTGTAVEEPEPE